MTEEGNHQKRHFTVPNKDELIEQIKNLDDQIEHISLNLIKCDFNATQKDVEKAFPDFKFIKIKNYNAGSFQVVLQMRIDAINFIRTSFDKKILSRRFFIKLGRQHKQLIQDWTGVGYAPKVFRHPHKTNFNKDHQNKDHQNKDHQNKEHPNKEHREPREHRQPREFKRHNDYKKPEQKQEQKTQTQTKTQQKKVQVPVQAKQQTVAVQKTEQVKKGKQIPKIDYHKKKVYNKPQGDHEKKPQHAVHQTEVKQDKPVQKHQQKKVEKTVVHHTKPVDQKPKEVTKPAEKVVEKVVQKAKVVVQEKPEDDGWVTIPTKATGKNKKR